VPAAPEEILRALADPERLAVAGALATCPQTSAELAARLAIPLDRVRRHLKRLAATGVVRVEDDRTTYRLDSATLQDAAVAVGPSREPGIEASGSGEDRAVVRAFFRDGRLVELPAKSSKRRVVLERLAVEFEPGVEYPERRVNEILGVFHDDVASLRRFLVDDRLLERDRGVYTRAPSAD
jgi:hypothetical protein